MQLKLESKEDLCRGAGPPEEADAVAVAFRVPAIARPAALGNRRDRRAGRGGRVRRAGVERIAYSVSGIAGVALDPTGYARRHTDYALRPDA
jgi:hypothetical protein